MRRYRTLQGDTWDIVAYREYKDENMTSLLIEANEEYADIVKFPAGIILDIPDADVSIPSTLPPWKK